VVASEATLILPDVVESEEFANDRFFLENGVRFYAGVPLKGPDGTVIGVLALLDDKPRDFTEVDREKLELEALKLMTRLNQLTRAEIA
jgi:GAF domain-containing protein